MPSLRHVRPLVLALALVAAIYTLFHSHRSARSPPSSKVTLVLAAYETDGLRPHWLQQILETYASPAYADIVAGIVLVWNRPGVEPPAGLPRGVKVVRAPVNSLNNRWTLTRRLVTTPSMLVTDNDLVLSKTAVKCLHRVWQSHPARLIGPFVRRRDGSSYVLDELVARPSPYNFVLPRALVGSTELVGRYADREWDNERSYVDKQEAHCDDILLNLIVGQTTRKAPLRVALPPGSIGDFATYCSPLNRPASSGLADQSSRASLRTECLAHFMNGGGKGGKGFGPEASPQGSLVAVCSDDGENFTPTTADVGLRRWRAMSNVTASELCPDLAENVALAPPPHALTSSSRSAVGAELAEYCPEVTKAVSEWIDVLESNVPLCPGTGGARGKEVEEVRENARYQCGAWCIWDLRLSTKSGWRLRLSPPSSGRGGMCFERFEDGHRECDEWWYQRPRFDL